MALGRITADFNRLLAVDDSGLLRWYLYVGDGSVGRVGRWHRSGRCDADVVADGDALGLQFAAARKGVMLASQSVTQSQASPSTGAAGSPTGAAQSTEITETVSSSPLVT